MPLHPFVIGQPHRIAALHDVLQYVTSHSDVWLATAGEIANWSLPTSLRRRRELSAGRTRGAKQMTKPAA